MMPPRVACMRDSPAISSHHCIHGSQQAYRVTIYEGHAAPVPPAAVKLPAIMTNLKTASYVDLPRTSVPAGKTFPS
jgi:hypothetical protein